MQRSNTQTIREVLERFLRETPLHRKLQERKIIDGWHDVMGLSVSKATGNIYIRDKILYVHLSSSVLRNELFMMKTDILVRLNDLTGEKIVADIVFR